MSNSKPASIRPHYGQRLLCCLQVCQPPNRRYIQDNHSTTGGYCTVFIGGKYRSVSFSISCGITTAYTASTTRRRNAFSVLISNVKSRTGITQGTSRRRTNSCYQSHKTVIDRKNHSGKTCSRLSAAFVNIVTVSPI